ncbi:N/A [soil metagenome]
MAAQLARRSIVLVTRLPSAFIPSIVFPIFLILAFSGAFSAITDIPAFPTDTILNWYVPLAVIQGSAFVGVGMGVSTARDIESGFYDRLLLAPIPRRALLAGPALAGVLRSLLPFTLVAVIGFLGGARVPGGPIGLLTLFAAAAGTCLLHVFWCLGLAYRLQSQRSAPVMQVGVFVTIFLATAQVPLAVMTGWLHAVARFNPMTNVLRLARAGFLGDVTWAACWGGLLALGVLIGLAALFAYRGLGKLVP